MYVEPWMMIGYILLVGFAAIYNRRKGFKSGMKNGISIGFDGALEMLELQKIITVKDGKILPYKEKSA